jgi:hypothetical protein
MSLRLAAKVPNLPFSIDEGGAAVETCVYDYIGPHYGLILTFP